MLYRIAVYKNVITNKDEQPFHTEIVDSASAEEADKYRLALCNRLDGFGNAMPLITEYEAKDIAIKAVNNSADAYIKELGGIGRDSAVVENIRNRIINELINKFQEV